VHRSGVGRRSAGKIYLPGNAKFFTYACPVLSATGYTITATDTFQSGNPLRLHHQRSQPPQDHVGSIGMGYIEHLLDHPQERGLLR
jgi:hypothetical protein